MLLYAPNRLKAIENIQANIRLGKFNDKVEPDDPVVDEEWLRKAVLSQLSVRDTLSYKCKNWLARTYVDLLMMRYSKGDSIEGLEKLSGLKGGAIVTSNHFNPFDTGPLRNLSRRTGRRHLWAVSTGTNFVMPGMNGFTLRYSDTVPIIDDKEYMYETFRPMLTAVLQKGNFVLIFPEQEMWFNYRRPRPGKRGAYLFAAENFVPVVSVFVEMRDIDKWLPSASSLENEGYFTQVSCVAHVLGVIYPDANLSVRDNSKMMCERDNELRREAYERIYHRSINAPFHFSDIAGYKGCSPASSE